MKLARRFLTMTFFVLISTSTFSQIISDTTKTGKVRRHELGLDITGFLKQFLNFNFDPFYSSTYYPTYYLTYRLHFEKMNLRMAIGGDGEYNDFVSPYPTDSNYRYERKTFSIDYRIGIEGFSNIGKRWQIYYGADFRPSFTYTKNDAPYWNGGYANGSESFTQVYGLSPLIGFRFRINSRLSFTTEASIAFNLQIQDSH